MPFANRAGALALAAAVLAAGAVAQRPTVEFKIKDKRVAVEYGAVPAGRHNLDELKVGETWRMGNNNASSMQTDLPLYAGDRLVAPGGYGVNVARPSDKELEFNVLAAGAALGASGAIGFAGEPTKLEKPAKKLDVSIVDAGKAEPGTKAAKIVVQYAGHKFESPVTVVGAKSAKAGEWAVDLFTYPKDYLSKRLEAGTATPVATIRRPDPTDAKKTLAFNVVATKDKAQLVPWMAAPTDNRGFGEAKAPASDAIKDGKAEWAAGQKKTEHLDLEKAEFKKGEGLVLRVNLGDQAGVLTLPDPLAKKA